ncbi:flavodoxin family protein [Chloroflexota bacterium]
MKICVLNGNPEPGELDEYVSRLSTFATERGHSVKVLQLRDMDIKYCVGCFSCWMKTPGECIAKDESPEVCRTFVHSDLLVCASPVKMGQVSAVSKKAIDKLLPLVLPYFKVAEGEIHHPQRYEHTRDLAVILQKDGADEEDLAIIERSFRRLCISFDSRFRLLKLTDEPVEEVVDALAAA